MAIGGDKVNVSVWGGVEGKILGSEYSWFCQKLLLFWLKIDSDQLLVAAHYTWAIDVHSNYKF